VALPQVLDYATLEPRGYESILAAPAPAVGITQVAVRDGVVMDSKGNWVHAWRVDELPAGVVAQRHAEAEAQAREAAKADRAAAVARITVDVDGKVFDGDEISQGRMARAILALDSTGATGTTWVLANNVPTSVTAADLRMALAKAGLAQTALWVL
jgi:hypothetical protein